MSDSYIPAELRRQVAERTGGCCEYCLIPETVAFVSHEIDHIVAVKHGGRTNADNLAVSCAICNRYKGSDPTSIDLDSGEIVPLFNPRREKWEDHLRIEGGRISALTATGRVTVCLLRLNEPDRVKERALLVQAGVIAP